MCSSPAGVVLCVPWGLLLGACGAAVVALATTESIAESRGTTQSAEACCYGSGPNCTVVDPSTCLTSYNGQPMGPGTDCTDSNGNGVADVCEQSAALDFGDAPEGALAYPGLGVTGQFPTCMTVGPFAWIQHQSSGLLYLGPGVDPEPDGNAGQCPGFPPYDADECASDGDAGLLLAQSYTINASAVVVPCPAGSGAPLGVTCTRAGWGSNLDIQIVNNRPLPAYVNLLFDWDRDGRWGGAWQCPGGLAAEHVLENFPVPPMFAGPLSLLDPPGFAIGPYPGYVWSRFTISDVLVETPEDWDGSGAFTDGETSDFLVRVDPREESHLDFGDAPEGALAYPSGVVGVFPTCVTAGPSLWIQHQSTGQLYLGQVVDFELDGNAGQCPGFPPYDADECWQEGDAGPMLPGAFTLDPALNLVSCPNGQPAPLGLTCDVAAWGPNVDVWVTNASPFVAYVNVLMDWDQNGRWLGASVCANGAAPEHVLVDFPVPVGFSSPLSALTPPTFRTGPNWNQVWARFTITDIPVGADWRGEGAFTDGETSDFLLQVDRGPTGIDGDVGTMATTGLRVDPNPTRDVTTVWLDLARGGWTSVGVYDVCGRRIRVLLDADKAPGSYPLAWDGRDDAGSRVRAGTYFVRLRSRETRCRGTVVMLR